MTVACYGSWGILVRSLGLVAIPGVEIQVTKELSEGEEEEEEEEGGD